MNLDFETFSECDIKFGAHRYAIDPTTEILCVAYGVDKDNIKLWYPGLPEPTELIEYIYERNELRGWNVNFEYCILKYVGTKLGWPAPSIKQTRCTQADALALALPASLDDAAKALETIAQKDKRGKQLITRLCKPKKPTKNSPETRRTKEKFPEEFEELYQYCIQDVKTEMEIFDILPKHVKNKELELFHLTMRINERGVPVDVELIDSILSARDKYVKRLDAKVLELTDGELCNTNSRNKALEWLARKGKALAGYTKGDVKKALESEDLQACVREFLRIRSELSRTPIKKFDFLKNALCPDGTVKDNIKFHKSTTGRYAGAGFQIQNLPRDSHENPEELIHKFKTGDTEDLEVINEAIKLTRSVITAPKGKKLVVSDFSSIENRKIAWVAGDYQTLEDFEKGLDQYKTAASSIYDTTYETVTKDQRQLGKIAVLSCGFGGGAKTFRKVCADSWGINISEKEAQDIVDGYREKYYLVKRLWYGLYEAAMDCVARKEITSYNMIKFRLKDDFLYMRLPNGRLLSYYKPKLQMVMTPWGQEKLALTHMGQNTYTRKWERLTVTPGRLTENAVQATARDCLTDSMLNIEKAGYYIIGCVHDEIISLVEEDYGSIEEFNSIMSISPDWAIDCPIEVEGYEDKRYRK